MRSVLLCSCGTKNLCAEDVHRFEVSNHRCLFITARIEWNDHKNNAKIRDRALLTGSDKGTRCVACLLHRLVFRPSTRMQETMRLVDDAVLEEKMSRDTRHTKHLKSPWVGFKRSPNRTAAEFRRHDTMPHSVAFLHSKYL